MLLQLYLKNNFSIQIFLKMSFRGVKIFLNVKNQGFLQYSKHKAVRP